MWAHLPLDLKEHALFRQFTAPTLSLEDVTAVLVEVNSAGPEVMRLNDSSFVIPIDDFRQVEVICGHAEGVKVCARMNGFPARILIVHTKHALLEGVKALFSMLTGKDISIASRSSARLRASEPATNIAKLAKMVRNRTIVAVFDPYLDNCGLQALLDIARLAQGSVSKEVRLLTSKDGVKSSRFSDSYLAAWFVECGAKHGELRVMASREHLRFMLLDDGSSVRLGCSLSDLQKNEVISLEPGEESLALFESCWNAAQVFRPPPPKTASP